MRDGEQGYARRYACLIILFFAIQLIGCEWVRAASLAGSREISVSGQMGQVKTTWKYSSRSLYDSYAHTEEATSTFMTLALRFGIYVYRGLAIEPEVHWSSLESAEPALSLHGNLAYNFDVATSPGQVRVMPFVLAGYGIGNSVPFSLSLYAPSSGTWNVGVLNLGAGLKAFITESVALRTEYRYQRYAWSEDRGYSKTETTEAFHNIFFGFSVFLPPHGEPKPK
jgi:opacity protein-like surface antigen